MTVWMNIITANEDKILVKSVILTHMIHSITIDTHSYKIVK